ncbi:MAG: serine protease [Myxococcota bacterium]
MLRTSTTRCLVVLIAIGAALPIASYTYGEDAPAPPHSPSEDGSPIEPQPEEGSDANTLPPKGSDRRKTHISGAQHGAEEASTTTTPLTARLYASHHRAIVRIDTAGGVGAGFLFHSPQHVATAFHVVARGRSIRTVLVAGERMGATVVAVDPQADLAILRLERPVSGVQPLQLWSGEPITIGTPVIAIGHPYSPLSRQTERLDGLLDWAVAQGVVSHRTEQMIQTDAALNPGNSGGPVIADDGRVVGVVSFKIGQGEGLSFAASWRELARLEGQLEDEGDRAYKGRWAIEASLDTFYQSTADVNNSALLGTGLGLTAVGFDRWAFSGRIALSGRAILIDDRSLIEEDTDRVMVQTDLAYRMLWLPFDDLPIYIAPTVGALFAFDNTQSSQLALELVDPSCTFDEGDRCVTEASVERESRRDRHIWPMIGASAMLGPLVVSYALLPTPRDLWSQRQLILGLQAEFLNF